MRAMTLLEFFCLGESEEDDELDFLTSPHRSFSNPFDQKPPSTIVNPTTVPSGPGISKKDQSPLARPNVPAGTRPPESRTKEPTTKPGYRGSFIGQTVKQAGQFSRKGVSWVDGPSGDRKYGAVQANRGNEWVWDGGDWVTGGTFGAKFGKR